MGNDSKTNTIPGYRFAAEPFVLLLLLSMARICAL